MYKSQNRNLGIFLAVLRASLWGLGGTISDYLFSIKNIQINWFMTSRLLISGSFLLIIHKILYNQTDIFKIWKSISTIIPLIIFSILGMLLVQYSFMASINYGNASVATMLQYIAPIYVILCFSLRDKIKLSLFDFITIFLTLIGMFLLLTNGSFQVLMVPSPSLIWGIISGLSLAFYTIYVNRLLINFNSLLIVGWSMIISGLIMNFIHPIWGIKPDDLSVITIMALLFSIFAGTALAFWFFIKSLEYLSSKETTLFGTVEPIVAIISSFLLLNVTFYKWQFIGIIIILFLITLISLKKPT